MGLGKSSPFLAFSVLVLCQAGSLHAAPLRSALESLPRSALENLPDPVVLSEKEGRLLLAALVQAYVQRKANELVEQEEQEQEQEAEDSSLDSSRAKRCGNLSTCVLGTYLKYLNNFHTFSGIGFGAETPGQIRDLASILEKDHYPNVGVPQNSK
ncbi:calcitonin-like isoform X1 [Saccopteryx bilineata]|uniref:calcitonin-like isoform X1 n=1 Tax=Saccopteryx bilineata TaxID=59482 RepID=UPI0033904097